MLPRCLGTINHIQYSIRGTCQESGIVDSVKSKNHKVLLSYYYLKPSKELVSYTIFRTSTLSLDFQVLGFKPVLTKWKKHYFRSCCPIWLSPETLVPPSPATTPHHTHTQSRLSEEDITCYEQ